MGHAVRGQAEGVLARITPDRMVAVTVAAILLVASVVSVSAGPSTKSSRPIGGPDGGGNAPRLAAGGAAGLDRDDWGGSAEGETGDAGSIEDLDVFIATGAEFVESDPGIISVIHNGIKIHDKVKITKDVTTSGLASDPCTPGPILLQDHGNVVQYRNIWLLPMK